MTNEVAYPKFRVFVGIAEGWGWVNLSWVIVSLAPLMPSIAADFKVSLGTVMIGVMALKNITGGIGLFLCGPLVDKYGPRKVMFVSAIILVIYSLMIPFLTHNMTQLTLLRLIAGLAGQGPLYAGTAAMAQRWFPRKEQSTWLGIWASGFAIGIALMYLVFSPLMKYFEGSWRAFGAFSAVPSAILAVLMGIALFGKEPAVVRPGGPAAVVRKDFFIALKLPVFWAGAILLGAAQCIMELVNALTPSYLMSPQPLGLHWLPFKAGPAMTFIQWGMIVSGFLMSAMLVYIFRGSLRWLASVCFLVAGLSAYFLTMSFSKASLSHMEISFFIVGYFMNLAYPAVTAFIAQNYPPHILGKVFGVCAGIAIFLGVFTMALSGALLDWTHTFTSVYGLILALGVFGCIVVAIMLNPIKAFAKREAPVAEAVAE